MKNKQPLLSGCYLTCKRLILFLMINVLLAAGCTKSFDVPGVASLNVFNGVVGTTRLSSDLSETPPIQWYKNSLSVLYGNAGSLNPVNIRTSPQFNSYSGDQRIKFFNYPDTLAHSLPLLDLRLSLPVNSISSLFLTGTVDDPDTLFVRDNFPLHTGTDSVTRIRIVNLVPGLSASVNLAGNSNGSEVASLEYKSVSDFISYPVPSNGTRYDFEIREANSGELVTTGVLDARDARQSTSFINYYRFKNLTMIIYGGIGNTGSTAPRVVLMGNY